MTVSHQSDEDYLPISLVTHAAFCERRTWLEVNGEKTDTSQMQSGFSAHKPVEDPTTSRSHRRTAVPLRSEKRGLSGRADEIEVLPDGSLHLLDYKASPVRKRAIVTPAQRLQLTLQKICLEDAGETVSSQSIYFTDHRRRVEVDIDSEDYAQARRLVERTREIVSSKKSPPTLVDDERCGSCSHFSVCLPDEHQLHEVTRRVHVSDPDGQVLHLTVQGSRASIKKGRVVVTKDGEELGDTPAERVHGVVVHGNIDLSSALHRNLLWNDVPIVWCSSTGRVYGFSRPTDGPNGQIRVQQHVLSHTGSLPIARQMIHSKIRNQGVFLRRNADSLEATNSLNASAKAALDAPDLPALFGIEGEAAAAYFSCFPEMLNQQQLDILGWTWPGRHGRGADDPINVLLNYAYGMLRTECLRAILSCGLDPHAGFLHSSNRNKPALALDLMEEFRAPIADSVVISMINRHQIKSSDFTTVGGAHRVRDTGRKKVITAFERRIQTSIRHPLFGYEVSWRRAIEVQARLILGVLDGSIPQYVGVKIR